MPLAIGAPEQLEEAVSCWRQDLSCHKRERNKSPNFLINLSSADKMHWEKQFGDHPTESNDKNMSRPVAFCQTEPSHWAAGASSVLRPQICWGQFYLFNPVISSHLIHGALGCFHMFHPQMNPNCPQSVPVHSWYICHMMTAYLTNWEVLWGRKLATYRTLRRNNCDCKACGAVLWSFLEV